MPLAHATARRSSCHCLPACLCTMPCTWRLAGSAAAVAPAQHAEMSCQLAWTCCATAHSCCRQPNVSDTSMPYVCRARQGHGARQSLSRQRPAIQHGIVAPPCLLVHSQPVGVLDGASYCNCPPADRQLVQCMCVYMAGWVGHAGGHARVAWQAGLRGRMAQR